ncbi:MAG: bifunctional DNA-binding transcriptional regulator/O6-methylguanine-DNA methyltransferase Ada [Gemmatimonadota bacterium]|nr:MAG: bifunctional DNA-binding transcriptional regulator/O6-methylguanine-DNA methyltransferase Ada [Gemmatimonadota bacterium]
MDDLSRWETVLARDSTYDGRFVYAVRSTGIYCRPSCPSRRPQREQVKFFPIPEVAERAGFRACRRCRPDLAHASDPLLERVRRVCRFIDEHPEAKRTLAQLAGHVGTSPHHLQRSFKAVLGITPRQYADARRLHRFKRELGNGASVTRALYEAGYGSSSRLYERASSQLGMTPATYRRGGRGARIRHTTTACTLGRLLVAATDRGVCAVSLGDDDASLTAALRDEYPHAEISRDDEGLGRWVEALLSYLDGRCRDVDLPLDVRATAFQRRVWELLRAIPSGETRSYSEMARQLGAPRAARAVARACASNPVSLIVPCHRAVRADGTPGGYRWGVERKQALLMKEREGRD